MQHRDRNRSGFADWSRRIIDKEWLILAMLLPVVLFPTSVTYVLLLAIPLLWLIRKTSYRHFILATPLDLSILGLLVMVLVNIYATHSITQSAPRIASLLYSIGVYYATAAASCRSQHRLAAGSILLVACGLVVVAVSIVGTRWGSGPLSPPAIIGAIPLVRLFPAAPEGFNPNQVAGTLLWTVPLLLVTVVAGLWMGERLLPGMGKRTRQLVVLLALVALIMTAGTLLLTQSRSALVGLTYAVLFMGLVARRFSWPIVIGGMLALTLVFAGLLLLLNGADGQPLLASLIDTELSASRQVAPLADLQGRIEIWSRALYGIEDFPIAGMGIGAFRWVAPIIYPFTRIPLDLDIGHAHNLFLQVALDLGIPGLIAYIALWLGCGAMLWRTWRAAASSPQRVLVLGFAGALVGYFVYGLTDAVTIGAKPAFIFWLLLGLIAGQHELIRRK